MGFITRIDNRLKDAKPWLSMPSDELLIMRLQLGHELYAAFERPTCGVNGKSGSELEY